MTAELVLDAVLVATIVLVALWVVATRRNFGAVAGFVAYGLLLAIAWVRLGAVDVALTEAAIGAGVSGVLLLAVTAHLRGRATMAEADRAGPALRLALGVLCAIIATALSAAVLALPEPAPSLAPVVAAQLPAFCSPTAPSTRC